MLQNYHCTFIDGGGGLFVSVRVFLLDMKLDNKLYYHCDLGLFLSLV
jgi:hypothetical protein